MGGRFEFYRTTGKGVTWDSTGLMLNPVGGESGSLSSLNVNPQVMSFGTINTKAVYFSTNGGANWQRKTVNSSFIDIPHTLFKDGMNGIVGDEYLLYRTTNGGNNWTPLPFNGVHFIQGIAGVGNHIYAGRRYVIYYSSDYGDSWVRQDSSVANIGLWAFEGKYYNGKLNMWGVGESGRISYYAFPVGIKQLSQTIPEIFELRQNYPNPFNPMCNVQFSMLNAGDVKIVVYDVMGKEVKTLVNERLSAGTYEVRFDAHHGGSSRELTSGVYFYRMVTEGFTETKRMLLVK